MDAVLAVAASGVVPAQGGRRGHFARAARPVGDKAGRGLVRHHAPPFRIALKKPIQVVHGVRPWVRGWRVCFPALGLGSAAVPVAACAEIRRRVARGRRR